MYANEMLWGWQRWELGMDGENARMKGKAEQNGHELEM
jgi:hypothetical protein